jgi:hypothetical protein
MPASQHPVFEQPLDTGVSIWRYMDFTKFVSLLDSKSLYFSRTDLLGDPFEGSITKSEANKRATHLQNVADLMGNQAIANPEFFIWCNQKQCHWNYVNCWHKNEQESASMWKLYGKSNEAIAIRSTFDRLSNALDLEIYIGMVRYIDYSIDEIPSDNIFWKFLHKRKSFEYENEVRAIYPYVVNDVPQGTNLIDYPLPNGVLKPIPLDELIEEIYVAPSAPEWLQKLVKNVITIYGLNKPVLRSSLDVGPLF